MKIKCKTYQPGTPTPKYVQAKLDGIWLTIEGGRCITSRPTDITDSLRWCESVQPFIENKHSILQCVHGELWLAGHKRSDVKTAIIEQNQALRFTPFAVGSMGQADALETVGEELRKIVPSHPYAFAPFFLSNSVCDDPQITLNVVKKHLAPAYLSTDIEGLVYKGGNLLNWQKWKPTRTIDLVVSGRTYGDGKYLGLIGSLLCSVFDGQGKLVEVAAISGMDDAVRRTISKQWPAALGTVVEVAYQYVGSRGRLTHPRFLHFREDKVAKNCTVDQDDELLTIWSNV